MGSILTKRYKKEDPQRQPPLRTFAVPLDVPVKLQLEFVVSYWLRDCGLTFPNDVVELIASTFVYHPIFGMEHDLKLKSRDPIRDYFVKYTMKFVIIGESNVGKTSLLTRYKEDIFEQNYYASVHMDFRTKTINIDGTTIKLQIWDTAGQERFRTITAAYFRGADGVILVYDVTNTRSLKRISEWNDLCLKSVPELYDKILVGNKKDLEETRAVSMEEGQQMADDLDISDHMETSAKTGENVESAIELLASRVVHRIRRVQTPWVIY